MEKQLIEGLRRGDESVFRCIYDCHYESLCRFADLFLHDTALAEEIVDDAIFYLWEHRAEVEIVYSLRAYLMKSVRNRCLNELNSLSHREELRFSSFSLPENVEFLDTLFVEKDHPLGYLLEQELEDELARSIEALPEECRTVFKKSRYEQKKYEEIAQELNISVNTVKYHIKNALSFLQKHMSGYLKLLLCYIFWGN
ncbi:RNA polymerase sigma-70 factor [Bacteroides mediterraneensis]|uniref:RNA polymerase sigma-70 factor n=1 Tax=Bacteroides mediterraneensis TaxID=1841856 RepID=A0ABS2EX51_9BACE|nr:RNA polymerase sigma-70 factor [Bacteroides mediterraneensis]MBM6759129.1 RNA polymerase sigma-70 factor [Bacteroides mediterraneensis]MBM6781043.1 RNA polymerase sigma-70 factor [Bacteroides mediterraneensis]